LLARAQDAAYTERWTERPVKNEALLRELFQILKEDQAVRAPLAEGRMLTEAEERAARERDEADAKGLAEFYRKTVDESSLPPQKTSKPRRK